LPLVSDVGIGHQVRQFGGTCRREPRLVAREPEGLGKVTTPSCGCATRPPCRC